MKPTFLRDSLAMIAVGALALVAGTTVRADYPSAVLTDGPLTYHRFSETGVANNALPLLVNAGSLGAAANGSTSTTFRDDLIARGVPGALADSANTAYTFPYSPNTHRNIIDVPWQAGLSYNGPFSVELWVKPATRFMSYPLSMVKYASPRSGWIIAQTDWDNLVTGQGWAFRLYNGANTSSTTATKTMPIDTNHWYHLVGVFNGTAALLFIDGQLAASTPLAGNGGTYAPAVSGNNLKFGIRGDNTFQWGGGMDEVAFYTNALTATDVAAHYAAATTNAAGYAAQILAHNPAGYWRLNETFSPSAAANSGSRGAAANGQYRTYSATVPELQGPAYAGFETDNRVLQVFGTNGQVCIPPLSLQTNTVTFEAMVKRNGDQTSYAGLLFHRSEITVGNQQACGLIFHTGNQIGYSWTAAGTSGFSWASGLVPADGVWTYVAVAIAPDQATVCMYDGTNWSSAVNAVNHNLPRPWSGPLRVGSNGGSGLNYWFKGMLDEPAFYARTLTEAQLRSHALAAFGDTNAPAFISGTPVVNPVIVYVGTSFTITHDIYGAPPLSFQWRHNGVDVPGATQSVFSKASAVADDLGNYDVVVTNRFGSVTSSSAYAIVIAADIPAITKDPVSRTVYPGGTAIFDVTASGQALRYQWKHAGTNLPGATASSLTIANVDASNTGNYTVTVSNESGEAPSAVATLSLLSADQYTYSWAVLADAPEAYWRLNETAGPTILDAVGRHNGTTVGTWTFSQPGALTGEADTCPTFNNGNYANIPWSADLNTPVYTVECWAKISTFASAAYNAVSSIDFQGDTASPLNVDDNYRSGYNLLSAVTTSAGTWKINTGNATTWAENYPLPPVTANAWTHLVGVYDGWAEMLYINGSLVNSNIAISLLNPTRPLYIGAGNQAWGAGNFFRGNIDEVAYYRTVLSPDRINLHYQLGKNGTNGVPVFITPPASQTVQAGTPVPFSAVLIGATPMTYQWKQNGASLASGTDLAFNIPSVDYTDAGQYTLAVTNASGGTVSAPATLVVAPPPSVTNLTSRITQTPTGPKLELIWPLGHTLFYSTDLTTGSWLPVPGATAPYYNVPVSPAIPQMFFKVE